MTLEAVLPFLLLAQAAMGAVDTILNHEIVAKLPRQAWARREIGLHSVREATYGALFVGLAWFEWHGALAAAIAALVLLEIVVTATDEVVENRTRVLPPNERVLHVFLTLNYGLIVAVLVPTLLGWSAQENALEPVPRGWTRWALLAFGLSSLAWSLRDLLAWRRLARHAPSGASVAS